MNSNLPDGTYIITGVNSTLEFLNFVGCPEAHIKRLLLSDSVEEDIVANFGAYRTVSNYSDLYEIEIVRHNNRMLDIKWQYAYQDYNLMISGILDQVAPTLEALSFTNFNPASSSQRDGFDYFRPDLFPFREEIDDVGFIRQQYVILGPKEYPLLKELSLRDPDDGGRRSAGALFHSTASSTIFPSLTHLHFASSVPYDVFRRVLQQVPVFSKIAPNITHVRFTGDHILDENAPWTAVEKKIYDSYPSTWEIFMRVLRGTAPPIIIRPPEMNGNLTIIVQPGFPTAPDLIEFESAVDITDPETRCSLSYYDLKLQGTLANSQVHLKPPVREDLEKYGPKAGVFSLSQAIEEFTSRSRGEEGEWAIPIPGPDSSFWWWKDGKPLLRCLRIREPEGHY